MVPRELISSAPHRIRKTQKSPTNPYGFFGLLSQRQTNVTGGSAMITVETSSFNRSQYKIKHLLRGTATVQLRG
jgi:hypothetical protein